jgi:hypothetical protein
MNASVLRYLPKLAIYFGEDENGLPVPSAAAGKS